MAAACVLVARAAISATFTVNSTADGTAGCATAGSVCTLRAAIQQANAHAGDDTIMIPAGTYTLTGAAGEDANATGDLDINDPSAGALTITGAGAATTFIDGGGIDRVFHIQSNTTIAGVTIRNGNVPSDSGGGIYNALGNLTLNDVVVTQNMAGLDGGGLQIDSGTITMNNVTVSGNTAGGNGGGINNEDTLLLNGVTLSGNTANSGGGIANDFTITLTNVTVSSNTAHTDGGGIKTNAIATLTNVTISGNTAEPGADSGGNYYYLSDAAFENVLVGDTPLGDSCTGFGGMLTTDDHNLDSGNTCGFTGAGDLVNTNPLLGPLEDNGGPTFTSALLPGSPAIDAGAGCPATDQRGVARPIDGNGDGTALCDIGAYEFDPSIPTTTTTTTLPACASDATFAAITCNLNELIGMVGRSVPAGPLQTGLEKSLTKARQLTGQAQTNAGRRARAKAQIGKAVGSLKKFKARLLTRKARKTLGDTVTELVQAAGRIQTSLKLLRGSL